MGTNKHSLKNKESILGVILITPSMLGFLLFYLIPYIRSLYFCFTTGVSGSFAGVDNFVSLLQSSTFRLALKNSMLFSIIGIPIIIGVSFTMAVVLKKAPKIFSVFVVIPLLIPTASVVIFFKIMFLENGYINSFLKLYGIQSINFIESKWSIAILVIIYIWKYFGYNTILFLTALNSISKQYYESAMLDGANKLQMFINITIPYCIPMSFLVFIMSFVNSFKIFRETILLFGIYPHENIYLIQHFMNNNFFNFSYQRLSTSAFLMISLVVCVVFLFFRWDEKLKKNLQCD